MSFNIKHRHVLYIEYLEQREEFPLYWITPLNSAFFYNLKQSDRRHAIEAVFTANHHLLKNCIQCPPFVFQRKYKTYGFNTTRKLWRC